MAPNNITLWVWRGKGARVKPDAALTANGKPKWGGAEVCPRCDKSVIIFRYIVL